VVRPPAAGGGMSGTRAVSYPGDQRYPDGLVTSTQRVPE
jgi:hypothetical protein